MTMASNALGRAGVMLPPTLPTIKETTLSWLGSDLESSLFSTNGKGEGDGGPRPRVVAPNVQRYIDFDEQCLSLKSGEGSDFSGIQPLPIGSDDTPPMAVHNFNKVVRMDFASLLETHNRPKPVIHSDSESIDEFILVPGVQSHHDLEAAVQQVENAEPTNQAATAADFEKLIGMIDDADVSANLSDVVNSGESDAMERLQLVRLWQLMQEEVLKRKQETELAMLQSQKLRMHTQPDERHFGLERVEDGSDDVDEVENDEIESGDLLSNLEEPFDDPESDKHDAEVESISHSAGDEKRDNFDEVPVEGQKRKSFDQLLEEELQKEQRVQKEDVKPKGPVKRPFLRKGQGLARFKGPPVRRQPLKAKPDNVTNDKPVKKEANKGNGARTKATTTKPPIKPSTANDKSQPVTNQKPAYKRTKLLPQKLTLKPEASATLKQKQNNNSNIPSEEKDVKNDTDLEEFEMLERYAEDDASFFSEPSLVVSLLRHETDDRTIKDEANMSLRERVRERRRLREEARKNLQKSISLGNSLKSNSGLEEREEVFEASSPTEDICKEDLDSTIQNESLKVDTGTCLDSERSLGPPSPYFKSSPETHKVKVIQRKTASLVKREKLVRPVAQPAANAGAFSPVKNPMTQLSSNPAFAKLQSSPNSAFSPHHQLAMDKKEESEVSDDEVESTGQEMNEFEDDKTWGDIDLSVLDGCQSPSSDSQGTKGTGSGREYKRSDYMEPESEDAENPVKDSDENAKSGGGTGRLSLSPPPPPTLLMQKLFPGLKLPKKSSLEKTEKGPSPPASEKDKRTESPVEEESSQASVLKQKLEELEKEISKFRKENAALEELRSKQEVQLRHLSKEMEEFKKQKQEELERLEEFKKTETKKLKRERKLFEEHVLATKMMPRKEEREEIQKLQEEMESLKSENKAKEQRWIAANNRMRGQVDRLEKENAELLERVKEMEEQRVKEWSKKKQNVMKAPSMWQAVNEIVESSVFDIENENPDRTNLSTAGSRQSSTTNKSKKSTKAASAKKTDTNPKSCIKLPSKPQVLNSHNENIIANESASSDSHSETTPKDNSHSETTHKDGKIERMLKDGGRLVEFPNGTRKEISADGQTVKVKFANGDIKQIYADGSIVYYYEENGTTHTTHPDGLQVFEFPNNQIEHHFPDGTKQLTFPDQTIKYLHTDGTEQTVFPDGTEMHVATNKDKTIVFANGQREIHTNNFKRREYPDGTSKTVFEDGRQETRYASGRLRVKDAHGNVIVDRMTNTAT